MRPKKIIHNYSIKYNRSKNVRTRELFFAQKKEIISDYKRRMHELIYSAIRTRTHFSKKIKKETVGHLVRVGEDEFEALDLLEKLNKYSLKCTKCGTQHLYVPNTETK